MCVCVCVLPAYVFVYRVCSALQRSKKVDHYEPPCGCWELIWILQRGFLLLRCFSSPLLKFQSCSIFFQITPLRLH